MVLVVEKKFLEEDWWKYALAIFLLQLLFWILLGYKINPTFTLKDAALNGRWIMGIFLFCALLPFTAGRLQLRSLFWFVFVGYLLSSSAYFTLALLGVGKTNPLLPIVGFLQVFVSCFGLGLIVELGRHVFRKLFE